MNNDHMDRLLSHAGEPLPSGPSPLRNLFRKGVDGPKDDPIRLAFEEWVRARAKSGPTFAVPADWFPRNYRLVDGTDPKDLK